MTTLREKLIKIGAKIVRHGRDGDKINAILAGAGYNYRLVLRWLRLLFARIMAAIFNAMPPSFTTMTNPA